MIFKANVRHLIALGSMEQGDLADLYNSIAFVKCAVSLRIICSCYLVLHNVIARFSGEVCNDLDGSFSHVLFYRTLEIQYYYLIHPVKSGGHKGMSSCQYLW